MGRPKKDITSQKFGRLVVIQEVSSGKNSKVKCLCDCGVEVQVLKSGLLRGYTKSCGCFRRESTAERRRKVKVDRVVEPQEFSLYESEDDFF